MERGAERSRETERGSERPREAQRGPGAGLRPLTEVYTPFAFVYRHRIAVKGILWNVAYSVGAHAALNTAALNFVDCGILWNAALNTEYSVVLLSIQRFAAFHPRCHSDHWRV